LQAASATYLQVRTGTLLGGLRVKDLMSASYETVSPDMSLQEFVSQRLMRTGRRCFLVVKDGQLLGMVTPNEVRGADSKNWPLQKVGDVMRTVEKVHFVSPDMPAVQALETMGREDVHQLPVLSNGRIEGVITRAHILQVLQSRSELSNITNLPRAA
ncbi:MAG: CBS domain-containing protein, partial [Candidatus Sulfotelmatobacter sp.]